MKYQRLGTLSVCLLALLTGSCGTWERITEYIAGDRAEKCPDAKILVEAANLPAFDPSKEGDPTNVVYTVTMQDAKLTCSYRKKQNRAVSDITLHFHAVRPSGGAKAIYRVPYFVALTTNGRVLEKKDYSQEVTFDEGKSMADVDVELEDFDLKPKRGRAVINYHYVTGFQLTQTQIDYNKKMGPFEP